MKPTEHDVSPARNRRGHLQKGHTGNTKFNLMIGRVRPVLESFTVENPFLGDFILQIFNDRTHNFRLGYEGAEALINVLRLTGVSDVLRSPEDVDLNPDVFWILLDEAKHQDSKRALNAVVLLYRAFYWKHWLGERFCSAPKSPAPYIHHGSFQELIVREYTCSTDLFYIGYSRHRYCRPMVIRYRNNDLRDMVIEAFTHWPNTYDLSSASLSLLYEAEDWFEDKAKDIRSFEDLTETVLSTGVNHLLRMEKGLKRRISRMQFLFWIFAWQIRLHPSHRFFVGSHIWSSGIVLDRRIPIHIANGFRFALYGQTDQVRQDHGILMIVKDGDFLSSAGKKEKIYQIDLSYITVPVYWRWVANYALHHSESRTNGCRDFIGWLMTRRAASGDRYDRITVDDLSKYRVYISHQVANGTARNKHINDVTKLLRWGSDYGYVTVDECAFQDFVYFDYHYTPDPEPLGLDVIHRLLEATERLIETHDERFALLLIIIKILLTCEIRVGALVRMRLSDLTALPDGSMIYHNRVKCHGARKHDIVLTKATAGLVREAIAMTEGVRAECPAGMFDEVVFIYRNPPCAPLPFGCFTTNRVGCDLRLASREAGIGDAVTCGRLRDTYMSAAERYARQKGLTDLQQMILTKHAAKFSTRSYTRLNLSDMIMVGSRVDLGHIK